MEARLELEHATLQRTLRRSDRVWALHVSPDRRTYEIEFDVRTLVRDDAGRVSEEERVAGVVYELHDDFPARGPLVVARENDLFNTHVHDPRRARRMPPLPVICVGTWYAQRRLADWVIATDEILRWARVATGSPLNPDAAEYARRASAHLGRFPVDRREFARREADAPLALRGPATHPAPAPPGGLRFVSDRRPA